MREEQAGAHYGVVGQVALGGESRRCNMVRERGQADGATVRVGDRNRLQPSITLILSQRSQVDSGKWERALQPYQRPGI